MGIYYGREGDKIEIIIRDAAGTKIEHHKCSLQDKKKYSAILRYLKEKYGIAPEIDVPLDEKVNWWD